MAPSARHTLQSEGLDLCMRRENPAEPARCPQCQAAPCISLLRVRAQRAEHVREALGVTSEEERPQAPLPITSPTCSPSAPTSPSQSPVISLTNPIPWDEPGFSKASQNAACSAPPRSSWSREDSAWGLGMLPSQRAALQLPLMGGKPHGSHPAPRGTAGYEQGSSMPACPAGVSSRCHSWLGCRSG